MAVSNVEHQYKGYPRHVSARELTVFEFINKCLIPNQPIIITDCIQDWPARRKWLVDDGTPNYSFLLDQFGNKTVPVTYCQTKKVQSMRFADFITKHLTDSHCDLYLRDWHFVSDDDAPSWYQVPRYFRNDWVNGEAFSAQSIFRGDYKFCYMGGSGTFTGFHSDVFNSYSWSANICGKKLWYMLPEGGELRLSGDCDTIDDLRLDPCFHQAGGFVFEQLPGEVVFVPSGYYHQVHNEGFTISINHNWINCFNLGKVVSLMFERLNCCMKEVRLMKNDLTEHVKYVEEFLRLDYGLNLESAADLCKLILAKTIQTSQLALSELPSKCSCSFFDTDCLCASCQHLIDRNNAAVCADVVDLLEAKRNELNDLKWLYDE